MRNGVSMQINIEHLSQWLRMRTGRGMVQSNGDSAKVPLG